MVVLIIVAVVVIVVEMFVVVREGRVARSRGRGAPGDPLQQIGQEI